MASTDAGERRLFHDQVKKMFLKIHFRFEDTQLSKNTPGLELAAYDCTVEIHDDRGAVHIGRVPEWWRP
jgi:hypothetical protein